MVVVSGPKQLLPRLTVERSSAFGVSSGIRILGEEVRVKALPGIRRQAEGTPPECGTRTVTLHNFAPGRGEVGISLRTDKSEEQLGKFEFAVNPLYSGAFSFGISRSALADPTFGLVFNGTDSIITESENSTRDDDDPTEEQGLLERQRILYGVFYTHFFTKRDIEKSPLIFGPTVGFALNDIDDNVFVGGSLLVQGSLSLMAGLHMGKVTRLDPESGLEVGSAFDGASGEIPTERRWRGDLYLGIALDLRAAARFLQTAFGAGGG
jgi:hypothetical protein